MEITKKIAEFVCETEYEDIPLDVVHQAKLIVLDTLGCAIAGYTLAEEEVEWILKFAHDQKAEGQSTIICDGYRTSSVNAALSNGVMAHTIDFDDTHMGSISHLGASLLATTFAVGEQAKASGKELIKAFVLGFEIGARLGRSVMPSHYKYWHPTATCGGVASAVAAAKIMQHNARQMEQMIGLAADATAGMRYSVEHGDFSKALHPGFAAMKAVIFSELVSNGANGPKGYLEYPTGFCNAYSTEPDIDKLLNNIGEHYEIMEDSIKSYPTIQCSHTSIEAILKLIKKHNVKPEAIKEIGIIQTETVPGQGCNYSPETSLAARLSTPFCVAVAVLDGEVTIEKFTADKISDRKVKELMGRVRIKGSEDMKKEYPETIAAVVNLSTVDGGKYTQTEIYPRGDPRNRLTDEEIKDKFTSLAKITLSQNKVDNIIDCVLSLEKLEDIRVLTDILYKAS